MKTISDCTMAELRHLLAITDNTARPLRYRALCNELSRREAAHDCNGGSAREDSDSQDIVAINPWFVRCIGVVAIGGCFIGITTIINHLMSPQGIFSYVIFALFILTFLIGIIISVRLIERCSVGALADNRNFWAIQTFFFSSPVMAYQLTNGLLINIWITNTDGLQHGFMIGSAFSLNFFNMNQPWAIGINLVAIAVTLYLQLTLNKFRKQQHAALVTP